MPDNKSPWFPLFVQDFLGGCRGMSEAEKGQYITMLCISWDIGPLPEQPADIKRDCDLKSVPSDRVLRKFPFTPNVGRLNPRLERERNKQAENREKKSQAGKRSGESRSRTKTNTCSTDVPVVFEQNHEQKRTLLTSPSTSPSEKLASSSDGVEKTIVDLNEPAAEISDATNKILHEIGREHEWNEKHRLELTRLLEEFPFKDVLESCHAAMALERFGGHRIIPWIDKRLSAKRSEGKLSESRNHKPEPVFSRVDE